MIIGRVTGLPDLRTALQGVVPKLRVKALRQELSAAMRGSVLRVARAATPVISAASPAVRLGYRKPGTVKKAIVVRSSKRDARAGNVGVFVNVRPAKGAVYRKGALVRASQRGAKNPKDPFYWRWLEFRHRVVARIRRAGPAGGRVRVARGNVRGFGMLRKGALQLQQALQLFVRGIGPRIQKLNQPKAPAP